MKSHLLLGVNKRSAFPHCPVSLIPRRKRAIPHFDYDFIRTFRLAHGNAAISEHQKEESRELGSALVLSHRAGVQLLSSVVYPLPGQQAGTPPGSAQGAGASTLYLRGETIKELSQEENTGENTSSIEG